MNSQEASIDLPNIDPSKLNKLSQRLVAPGHGSTNYQFPGHQVYFRDFIISAEKHATFIEQLKIIITNELLEINNSSFEILNLTSVDEQHENTTSHEYVVSAETLTNLTVLAKFLGFILSRPFQYEFGLNAQVDSRQIEMRNKVRKRF